MAILMYGAPGALFNCLGKCGLLIKTLQAFQLAQESNLLSQSAGLYGQLNNEEDVQAIVGDSYIQALSGSDSSFPSIATQVATAYLNRLVFRDNPQLGQTLTAFNTLTSIGEVIRQMKLQWANVLAVPVTQAPTQFAAVGGNTGNGAVVCSVSRPLDGRVLENSFGENLKFVCVTDSYVGGAVAYNELFSISGAGAENDFFAWDWPLGSNGSTSVSAVDGDTSVGSNNLLTNSGWTTWAAGTPSNWAVASGGGNIAQESGLVFSPGSALKFTGDGTTLLSVSQQFNATAGTQGTLGPLSQYSWAGWLRRGGAAVTGGAAMVVELVDGNGSVIKDQGGNSNSIPIDLTTLGVGYSPFTGVFRLPEILPSQMFIRYRHTAAVGNGQAVYLDKTGLGAMAQLYTSGPFVNVHSGGVPFVFNDLASVLITNGRGAGGSLDTFQTLFAQLFSGLVYSNEILLPSSASPTISDSLIG